MFHLTDYHLHHIRKRLYTILAWSMRKKKLNHEINFRIRWRFPFLAKRKNHFRKEVRDTVTKRLIERRHVPDVQLLDCWSSTYSCFTLLNRNSSSMHHSTYTNIVALNNKYKFPPFTLHIERSRREKNMRWIFSFRYYYRSGSCHTLSHSFSLFWSCLRSVGHMGSFVQAHFFCACRLGTGFYWKIWNS